MNKNSFFYGLGAGIILTAIIFYLTFTIERLGHNSKVNNIDIRSNVESIVNLTNGYKEINGINTIDLDKN